jgi:HEAT repeat protein
MQVNDISKELMQANDIPQELIEKLRSSKTSSTALDALAKPFAKLPVAAVTVAVLAHTETEELRYKVRGVLVRLPTRANAELLAVASGSSNAAVFAAEFMFYATGPEMLPYALQLLKSKKTDVVDAATRALGSIGGPEVRSPLLKLLAHRTMTVRDSAADSIRSCADADWTAEILDAIRRLDEEGSQKQKDYSDITGKLAEAIDKITAPSQLQRFIDGLRDPNPVIWRACVRAVGALAAPAAVQPLLEVLAPETRPPYPSGMTPQQVRAYVYEALGSIRDRRAVPVLIAAMPNRFAGQALGQIGAGEAVDVLCDTIARERWGTSLDVSIYSQALSRLQGEQVEPRLMQALSAQSPILRGAAALTLLPRHPELAIAALEALLEEPRDNAFQLAEALIGIGKERWYSVLESGLADVTKNAHGLIHICGRLRGPRARRILVKVLAGCPKDKLWDAAKAIAAHGAEIVPELVEASRSAPKDELYRYEFTVQEFKDPPGLALLEQVAATAGEPLRKSARLACSIAADRAA